MRKTQYLILILTFFSVYSSGLYAAFMEECTAGRTEENPCAGDITYFKPASCKISADLALVQNEIETSVNILNGGCLLPDERRCGKHNWYSASSFDDKMKTQVAYNCHEAALLCMKYDASGCRGNYNKILGYLMETCRVQYSAHDLSNIDICPVYAKEFRNFADNLSGEAHVKAIQTAVDMLSPQGKYGKYSRIRNSFRPVLAKKP